MPRLTLQNDLLDELGSRIVDGRYAPGDMLRTEEIERQFTLSRTVVRESLKVLESMHMIEIRRAVGITILDRSRWSVFDPRIIGWRLAGPDRLQQLVSLTELRVAVEPVAAYSFALSSDEAQRSALQRAADDMTRARDTGDVHSFIEADVVFHATLLEGSGNEMFASLSQVLSTQLRSIRPGPATEIATERFLTLDAHLLLTGFLVSGDHTAAERAAREVLSRAREELEIPRGVREHRHAPAS